MVILLFIVKVLNKFHNSTIFLKVIDKTRKHLYNNIVTIT